LFDVAYNIAMDTIVAWLGDPTVSSLLALVAVCACSAFTLRNLRG